MISCFPYGARAGFLIIVALSTSLAESSETQLQVVGIGSIITETAQNGPRKKYPSTARKTKEGVVCHTSETK